MPFSEPWFPPRGITNRQQCQIELSTKWVKYRLDDPIIRLRAQLTREGKLTNEQFDQLDKRAKQAVLDAVKFAEESSELPVEKLHDYVYFNGAKS